MPDCVQVRESLKYRIVRARLRKCVRAFLLQGSGDRVPTLSIFCDKDRDIDLFDSI